MLLQQVPDVFLLLFLEERTGFHEIYLDSLEKLELQQNPQNILHQRASSWSELDERHWQVQCRVGRVPEFSLVEEVDDPEADHLAESRVPLQTSGRFQAT